MELKNAYELREAYKITHPDGHFFDKETLKFFGERMSEMRLLKDKEVVKDYHGENHTCYVLRKNQRNHPSGPRIHYSYFDQDTLEIIFKED